MKKISAVIIDDEYSNRELLSDLISGHQDFEVLGLADGVMSGIALIKEKKPDAVFLDIRMPDGNGFELLDQISNIDFFVVFVSAFDSYALKAFDFNAVDYILKPIDQSKFELVMEKLRLLVNERMVADNGLRQLLDQYDVNNLLIRKIQVHSGNKVLLLPLSEIVYAMSDEGSTLFKTNNGSKYNSSKQLSDFDFIFESYAPLIRISKAVYVNINFIDSYSKGSTCMVFMKYGQDFEVSKRKKAEILALLSKAG